MKVPVFKAIDTGAISQVCLTLHPSLKYRPVLSLPMLASQDHTGLSKGGQQIAKARTTFAKAVDVLVQVRHGRHALRWMRSGDRAWP